MHDSSSLADARAQSTGAYPSNDARRVLLIFRISDCLAAFPVDDVERVTQIAALAHPPGLPAMLEGFLDLGGAAVPVVRPDRLFRLPEINPKLYSVIIVLRGPEYARVAVLVDRVLDVLPVSEERLRPLEQGDSFNGCAEGVFLFGDESVHVLASNRMLLAKEKEVLADFQSREQQRLAEWKAATC